MSAINGIFVSLDTADPWWAGTDDHLYLGVVGTVGGREFALDNRSVDDFEPGVMTYRIGPGAHVFGGIIPDHAGGQLANMTICLPNVTHVYLRKQGDRSSSGDDMWKLDHAFVYLIAPGEPTRVFQSTGVARLGNEYGHTVWLGEVAHSGAFRDARIPIDGVAECEAVD